MESSIKYIDVIYGGEVYIFASGFCEIQEKNNQFNIQLAYVSELELQSG